MHSPESGNATARIATKLLQAGKDRLPQGEPVLGGGRDLDLIKQEEQDAGDAGRPRFAIKRAGIKPGRGQRIASPAAVDAAAAAG